MKFDNKFWKKIILISLIMVFSGVFGFIYEMIFYRIDLGYFIKRGTTYGPWIPIYGFGGLFIVGITYSFRKKPVTIFLLSSLISGIIEFLTGYILFNYKGIRLWDYNVEIWNFGNIGGYVCLRSILFFGISGLFLVYAVSPFFYKISEKIYKNKIGLIPILLELTFIIDIIISNIFHI